MPTDRPPEPEAEAPGAPPVDPDVPAERPRVARHAAYLIRDRWDVLGVIGLGGAIGSGARYGVAQVLPHAPGQAAWSTFTVNIVGGFLLGVLMVLVNDVWPPSRYVRPLLGVGVLGGFTTFSTYMLDTWSMLDSGDPVGAMAYLFGTLLIGLLAVWLGILAGRLAARLLRRQRRSSAGAAPPPPVRPDDNAR